MPDAATGHPGKVMAVLRATLVAVVLAGVLAAAGCSPASRCPAGASCPATLPFTVTFGVTVNGRGPFDSRNMPRFSVRAGQLVMISVRVTVPRRARVSALSLGISAGTIGGRPEHPIGVDPVLLYSRQVLMAGSHSFRIHWRVPAKTRPGKHMYLVANWASRQPPTFAVAQCIAHLALT